MNKILVSVVNYCDPEFYFTVKSLWDAAKNKENLIFSLVSEDSVKHNFDFIPSNQLYYRHYDLSQYRGGLCWARNLATQIDQDFDYFIQFDSHTYATYGWDEEAIMLYNKLPEGKNIISYCPAEYEINGDGTINTNAHPLMSTIASNFSNLVPGFTFPGYRLLKPDEMAIGFWVTCCYLFTPKSWIEEVGIDQFSSFNTEEINLSIRTYAKDWTIYANGNRKVFHHSSHRQPNGTITRRDLRPWADDRKNDYWSHVKKATNFLSRLMSGQEDVTIEKVKSFFTLAGISEKYLQYDPNYYSHIEIPNRGYGMPPARDYN